MNLTFCITESYIIAFSTRHSRESGNPVLDSRFRGNDYYFPCNCFQNFLKKIKRSQCVNRLLIRLIVLSFCALFTFALSAYECQQEDPTVSDIKEMSCAITDLWMAMANEQLSKVIANSDFFVEYQEGDIVRTEQLALRLEKAIANTHQQYQMENSSKRDYTFSVTTYPAEVKEGTCRGSSTIQKRELSKDTRQLVQASNTQASTAQATSQRSQVFADYSPIEGKEPRYFQLRKKEDGKLVVCEKSTLSHSEKISLFCGDDQKCINSLPASCDQLDQGKNSATSACVLPNQTKPIIQDFLGAKLSGGPNLSLEHNFCPEDCSFYTQTLQKVHKIEGTDQYCTENYLIIHCGAKADGTIRRTFNLNIREVDDFCEDFNVICQRAGQPEEESVDDVNEKGVGLSEEGIDLPVEGIPAGGVGLPEEDMNVPDEGIPAGGVGLPEEGIDLPAEEFPGESSTESGDESSIDKISEPSIEEEEETSAQPIDEILEEKPSHDHWLRNFFRRLFRGKRQNENKD